MTKYMYCKAITTHSAHSIGIRIIYSPHFELLVNFELVHSNIFVLYSNRVNTDHRSNNRSCVGGSLIITYGSSCYCRVRDG